MLCFAERRCKGDARYSCPIPTTRTKFDSGQRPSSVEPGDRRSSDCIARENLMAGACVLPRANKQLGRFAASASIWTIVVVEAKHIRGVLEACSTMFSRDSSVSGAGTGGPSVC